MFKFVNIEEGVIYKKEKKIKEQGVLGTKECEVHES